MASPSHSEPAVRTCPYVVDYENEPPGSDVVDPRVRCGKPATVRLDGDEWLCPEHARVVRQRRDHPTD